MLIESTRDSLCFSLAHYKHGKQQYSLQVGGHAVEGTLGTPWDPLPDPTTLPVLPRPRAWRRSACGLTTSSGSSWRTTMPPSPKR